jgi:hypothetical protein
MLALACLASLVLIPWLAMRGLGYRGVYLAGTVAALLFGFFVLSIPTGVRPGAPEAEQRGAEIMDAYGPSVGGWLVVTGVGFVLGACLFRQPSK